ncbi:Putative acyl-CoA dehydrogenase AidB [Marinomonas spartinae]|uniref:Putative acyl-CoA dehydrogenase AidB n=1 Tax=Marinomonas spartinae TaxID=1792290 RepID=A0A1A8TIE8_9GAMM|nr:acyl-CoA dehydrogenase family protein [Marinomonas spartinae]SBS32541.1 Putative acyl-CoA dehydrogenase AidB [Marinomonas spartinae]
MAFMNGETHQVFNQPKALEHYNAYLADRVLQYWQQRFDGGWGTEFLTDFGARVGGDLQQAGFLANKCLPELHTHNRFGERIDQVDYHPSYHQLMQHAIEHGHCSLPWQKPQAGSHVVRSTLAVLHTHADPGSGCPLTMTFASVPAISVQPSVAKLWLPKIFANHYDGDNKPWFEKQGVTIGMAMTEKQGGSDVRANTTTATPLNASGPGELYSLLGHKWFCSAPMSDAFLVLAKMDDTQLSCFLVPRWCEDGQKNAIYLQRLKDKLGNQSNASSEIEFRGAQGWLLGEPGRGIATIIQMVALTRYDCMLGSSALMMQAAKEAIWHTSGRSVFGKNLHQQPLMLNVLADLALEAEAALAISMRIAHALDNMADEKQAALVRSATAIGKYWICKRAVQHTYEAMECVGGVGYVQDNVLSRLYKEAPVNAIWEGSGNVQCLDLLRVFNREPDTLKVFLEELELARQANPLYAKKLDSAYRLLEDKAHLEVQARRVIETLAQLWQAACLLIYGDEDIADAFVTARFSDHGFHQYGCLDSGIDMAKIVARFMPKGDH